MRIPFGPILVGGALCIAGGCAQRTGTITAKPSQDELPNLTELEPISPVTAVVEGRGNQPRFELVQPFKEPELTPEEQRVLGQRREVFKFLLYDLPGPRPGSKLGTWFGGVRAESYGRGGAGAIQGGRAAVGAVAGGRSDVVTGTDTFGSHVAATGTTARRPGETGPESGVRVDEDRPSKIAERKTRRDR